MEQLMLLGEFSELFEVVQLRDSDTPEFPLDFIAPGNTHGIKATAVGPNGPEKYVDADFVWVPCQIEDIEELAQLAFDVVKVAAEDNTIIEISRGDGRAERHISLMRTLMRRVNKSRMTHLIVHEDMKLDTSNHMCMLLLESLTIIRTNCLKENEMIGIDNTYSGSLICVRSKGKYGLAVLNNAKLFFGKVSKEE
jgi:hypothetical protein